MNIIIILLCGSFISPKTISNPIPPTMTQPNTAAPADNKQVNKPINPMPIDSKPVDNKVANKPTDINATEVKSEDESGMKLDSPSAKRTENINSNGSTKVSTSILPGRTTIISSNGFKNAMSLCLLALVY